MKVELTPRLERLVQAQIDAGLYANPLDVLESAVSLLDAQNLNLARLRGSIAAARREVSERRGTVVESEAQLAELFDGP